MSYGCDSSGHLLPQCPGISECHENNEVPFHSAALVSYPHHTYFLIGSQASAKAPQGTVASAMGDSLTEECLVLKVRHSAELHMKSPAALKSIVTHVVGEEAASEGVALQFELRALAHGLASRRPRYTTGTQQLTRLSSILGMVYVGRCMRI